MNKEKLQFIFIVLLLVLALIFVVYFLLHGGASGLDAFMDVKVRDLTVGELTLILTAYGLLFGKSW